MFETLFPKGYFQKELETLTLKQLTSHLYFLFSKPFYAVVLVTMFLCIKSNQSGFIDMAPFSHIPWRAGLVDNN